MSEERLQTGTLSTEAGKLILVASFCLLLCSCRPVPKSVKAEPAIENQAAGTQKRYGAPKKVGSLKSKTVDESSGLVASRSMPGMYWTHNDSGDGPFLYGVSSEGDLNGVWRVTGAQAVDWEDISIGPGPELGKTYLYIGDIGDNDSVRREIVVYRVKEPAETDRSSTKTKPQATESTEAIRLRYPDGKHDAEALLVDPGTGDIYIVTKVALGRPSVYEAQAPFASDQPTTLKRLGELRIPSPFGGVITGGSVSPDGKHVALCDYFQAFELVLPTTSNRFEDIWKQPIVSFNFGKREQGESIAYRLDGRALLGTSEGKGAAIVEVDLNP
ncbi:MAG TPA: hypothetical protein VLE19_03185 [Pyrinomonadaceae bacterium]|nr:hypothetical protein [Pyrinomonadaceae bacterium]